MFLNIVKLKKNFVEKKQEFGQRIHRYISILVKIFQFKIINERNWMKFSLRCDEET